mmetsp:Transcript_105071/g.181211  ORF Transcript_105071/g.181211 Transcript_105071/m.181211 type:complete len:340 (-) Transcript_105071:197-1216(-)
MDYTTPVGHPYSPVRYQAPRPPHHHPAGAVPHAGVGSSWPSRTGRPLQVPDAPAEQVPEHGREGLHAPLRDVGLVLHVLLLHPLGVARIDAVGDHLDGHEVELHLHRHLGLRCAFHVKSCDAECLDEVHLLLGHGVADLGPHDPLNQVQVRSHAVGVHHRSPEHAPVVGHLTAGPHTVDEHAPAGQDAVPDLRQARPAPGSPERDEEVRLQLLLNQGDQRRYLGIPTVMAFVVHRVGHLHDGQRVGSRLVLHGARPGLAQMHQLLHDVWSFLRLEVLQYREDLLRDHHKQHHVLDNLVWIVDCALGQVLLQIGHFILVNNLNVGQLRDGVEGLAQHLAE